MSLVPTLLGRGFARNALQLQKASPGVLLGAGIVGMVGGTVLACRATLKMESVLDEAKEKMEMANKAAVEHPTEYSVTDRQRDVSLIYFQTGVKVVKLYAPAVILGGLSIAALTSSYRILNNRNIALTAAYGALEEGFARYRQRVVEKYGEEQDRDFRYGTREVEIPDPDDARKKQKKTRVALGQHSIYAKFFDESSRSFDKDPEYNRIFLQCQQNYANDLLNSRGHVFLNEVYDMLDIPRTKAGAAVGWVLSKDGSTDNFVNFGIFDDREQIRDFVNGYEGAILLDFNVDGVIWNKIGEDN